MGDDFHEPDTNILVATPECRINLVSIILLILN